jgi:hypothetical protein
MDTVGELTLTIDPDSDYQKWLNEVLETYADEYDGYSLKITPPRRGSKEKTALVEMVIFRFDGHRKRRIATKKALFRYKLENSIFTKKEKTKK